MKRELLLGQRMGDPMRWFAIIRDELSSWRCPRGHATLPGARRCLREHARAQLREHTA